MIDNIKTKKIIIFVSLLLTCILLTCCSNPYLSENDKNMPTLSIPDVQVKPDVNTPAKAEGHIKLGIYEFDTFNPLLTKNRALQKYLSLVYESLIIFDKDCKPCNNLAKEIITEDGGFSWLITLKDGIVFHDGSNLTSYDIKNTIEWIKTNDCSYTEITNNISSIEIIKNNVLKINLSSDDSLFPSKLSFPIIKSEDLIGDFKTLNGTGMYKQKNNNTFEIFENYHGTFPKIKSFEIISFETSQELYDSDADIIMWFGDDAIRYSSKQNYSTGFYNDNILSCIIPSQNVDVNLKNYINSLLDKNVIAKSIYAEKATVKYVPIPEKTYFLNNFIQENTPTFEKNDLILPETIKLIVRKTDYDLIRLVQFVEKSLPQNIILETLICKNEEYSELISTGKYDFAFENIELKNYPDFYNLFHTSGGDNINLFSDVSVDNLIMSIKEAFKNYNTSLVTNYDEFCNFTSSQTAKLAFILNEKLPILPICQRNASVFVNKRLTGISLYNFNFWNTLDCFKNLEIK